MSASHGPILFHPSVGGGALRPSAATKWAAPFVTAVNARTDAESASAIQRMLADVAAVVQRDDADVVLAALRTTASRAFFSGGESAWRQLYVAIASIIERSPNRNVPAFGRLCAFLDENDDLIECKTTRT